MKIEGSRPAQRDRAPHRRMLRRGDAASARGNAQCCRSKRSAICSGSKATRVSPARVKTMRRRCTIGCSRSTSDSHELAKTQRPRCVAARRRLGSAEARVPRARHRRRVRTHHPALRRARRMCRRSMPRRRIGWRTAEPFSRARRGHAERAPAVRQHALRRGAIAARSASSRRSILRTCGAGRRTRPPRTAICVGDANGQAVVVPARGGPRRAAASSR